MMINSDDLRGMMQSISKKISANKEELNRLDAALGDGDHGTGISTGFEATLDPIQDAKTPAELFKVSAMQLMNRMGGTSGAMFGTLYLKGAMSLPADEEITPAQFAEMWKAGCDGMAQRGKAEIGDKTMLDALSPAVDALKENIEADKPFVEALRLAKDAAIKGADSTSAMQAKHGRAKYIGERAIGHMDAGARSITLMFEAILEYFEANHDGET